MTRLSNVVGFDDGPFQKAKEARPPAAPPRPVLLVGAVCARTRLDGLLASQIQQDGTDATDQMAALVRDSRFDGHIRAVLINGIAVGGFNVIDIHRLATTLKRPVLVVARRAPRLAAIRRGLDHFADGAQRWALIQQAGPMEAARGVYIQRAGLTLAAAEALLAATTIHGCIPEPLRLAHVIAGGIVTGESRGRA